MPLTLVLVVVFLVTFALAFAFMRLMRPLLSAGAELRRAQREAKRQVAEHREAQEAAAPPTVQVQGATRSNRCPYCHTDVSEAGVACAECLARHHLECWDEHRECASCGSAERFTQVERTAGRERAPDPKLKPKQEQERNPPV